MWGRGSRRGMCGMIDILVCMWMLCFFFIIRGLREFRRVFLFCSVCSRALLQHGSVRDGARMQCFRLSSETLIETLTLERSCNGQAVTASGSAHRSMLSSPDVSQNPKAEKSEFSTGLHLRAPRRQPLPRAYIAHVSAETSRNMDDNWCFRECSIFGLDVQLGRRDLEPPERTLVTRADSRQPPPSS